MINSYVWLTIVIIAGILAGVWLAVKSGDKYSPEDASAHAEEFGGVIAESHGPITDFLYVSYAIMILWALVYLWQHWSEFMHLST
ncbi:MAG: hypothetical protein FIB07_12380 [Candidatus Methanoperedens sp.]|nr:hypothetical protein [Candidatus Methanoperedens sp.]